MRWIWMCFISAAAITIGPRVGHSLSDESAWRSTLPGSDSDGAEISRDVVTKVVANTADTVRFLQASSDGIYREVTIKWTPSDNRIAADDDLEVVLEDGRRFLVRHPTGTPTEDGLGYAISFDFYLLRSSMPEEFAKLAAISDSSTLATIARLLGSVFAPSAWAAGEEGWSGSFTDVKTFVKEQAIEGWKAQKSQDFREALREREVLEGRAKLDACFQFEMTKAQDWVRRMRQWNAAMAAAGLEGKPASALSNSPQQSALKAKWDALYGEALSADARAHWKGLSQADRDRFSKSRASGVDAAMAKDQIERHKRALKERIAALRRCHENPTAPTAIRAKNENDPARDQIFEALDTVELQVDIDSGIAEAAALLNSAASTGLGPLGTGLTGTLGAIEDKLLKDSMETAVASLEECVVRCDPCTAGPASATLVSAAPAPGNQPNYTPGPTPRVTPPPLPQVCKPMSSAEVWYHHVYSQTDCNQFGCGTQEDVLQFTGTAPLKYIQTGQAGGIAKEVGYEGTGTVDLRGMVSNTDPPNRFCPAGQLMRNSLAGPGTMAVRAQFSIDDSFIDGRVGSRLIPESSEVSVIVDGQFTRQVQFSLCEESERTEIASGGGNGLYQCTFREVDLLRGGHFVTGPQNGPDGSIGYCEITIH